MGWVVMRNHYLHLIDIGDMEPNIVLIVADALRWDKIGVYGGRDLTPNIDELSSESVVAKNCFTTINATDGAITSLHTGRYPLSSGVVNHGPRVTSEEKNSIESLPQLPELLQKAGYRTAKFGRPLGRWHRNGFDRYPSSIEGEAAFDTITSEGIHYKIETVLNQIHPKLTDVASKVYNTGVKPIEAKLSRRRDLQSAKKSLSSGEDKVVKNFRNFLDDQSRFYTMIHLMDTHVPYTVDPEKVRSYLNKYDYETDAGYDINKNIAPLFNKKIANGDYPSIKDKYYLPDGKPTTAVVNAHYDVAVSELDKRVGKIVDSLKQKNMYENTVLIFLSDHGESLTEHGIYYDHHGLYDVSVHIPLIIRTPSPDTERDEIGELTQITDIAPTIASFANIQMEDPDGHSLLPVIKQEGQIGREFVMAEEAHTQRRRMIRSESEKLIYHVGGNKVCRYCGIQHAPVKEFYNLESDPEEKNNIAEENPEKVERLQTIAENNVEIFEAKRPNTDSTDKSYEDEEEIHEQLEALGYR